MRAGDGLKYKIDAASFAAGELDFDADVKQR
jgi:hypothetical protein